MADKMRGLESLIPQKNTAATPRSEDRPQRRAQAPTGDILMADIYSIKPNPLQPRRSFSNDNLKELTDSIRMYGVLQPLLVNRIKDTVQEGILYELIAGERRLRAAKQAQLNEVPVIVREMPERTQKLEVALIENIQRDNLNPIEEGRAFQQLHDELGVSYDNISKRVARSQPYIVNTVRILKLPPHIQEALLNSDITTGHTRPLLSLHHIPHKQEELFSSIMDDKMTVREAERMAQDMVSGDGFVRQRRVSTAMTDSDTVELLDVLNDVSGVIGVEARTRNGKSRISISFRSKDDLHRWLESIQTKTQS